MTEREYRKLRLVSYSSLKTFADSRQSYFKTYEEPDVVVEEDESEAMTLGKIVDCILLEPEDFDNRFVKATCSKPTGQMGDFVDELFKGTKSALSVDGVVTASMGMLLRNAYDAVAFNSLGERVAFKRKTFEQVVEEFTNGVGREFYEQQRESLDRILIGPAEEEKAQKVVDSLNQSGLTKDLMTLKTGGKYVVYNQLIITFPYNYLDCKSMLDKVIVNIKDKIIQPFDLKTTHNVDNFGYTYLKYRYYIQAVMYDTALRYWAQFSGYGDFVVKPMKFIVADSNAVSHPLIYVLEPEDITNSKLGFDVGGKQYVGVDKLVTDLIWHKSTGIWDISVDNHENGGICALNYL